MQVKKIIISTVAFFSLAQAQNASNVTSTNGAPAQFGDNIAINAGAMGALLAGAFACLI